MSGLRAPASVSAMPDPVHQIERPGDDLPWLAYRQGELHLEDVPLRRLAEEHGTPCYGYSGRAMEVRYQALRAAFGADAKICFAVKSCSNLSVLRHFGQLGCGFDLVSGGELARVRAAGLPTEGAVFAGVGKQSWEIQQALSAGIRFFNVESPFELDLLRQAGAATGRVVPLALRINPDVDPGAGHAYIRTGKDADKFGLGLDAAASAVRTIAGDPHLELVGYHVHLGSMIRTVAPYLEALQVVLGFMDADPLHRQGVRYYDMGGGFGVSYGDGQGPLDPAPVAGALLPELRARGLTPVLEPGRFLVADAGVLVVQVLGSKPGPRKGFVLVDGAMNDLLRPALYQAHHPIVPLREGASPPADAPPQDVVGPVCESGDFLGKDRALPRLDRGDLLAVLGAGAYGASMGSNYNSRPRPPEVLVNRGEARLIRTRETLEDLWANERVGLDGPPPQPTAGPTQP